MAIPKQKKQILSMLAILLFTASAFFGVTAFNSYSAAKNEDDTINIATVTDIQSLSYNNGTDSLAFELNDEGKWYCTENPDFPLQTSYIESIVSTIQNLQAIREISAADQDSQAAYGLENPSATISISGTNGQTDNILIGGKTSAGYYYLKLSDSETVYTVDSQLFAAINQSLYDMAEIEDIPAFDIGKLNSVQIDNKTITVETKASQTDNGSDNSQKEILWYSDGTDVSAYSQISALTYSIPYLAFSNLAVWQPTPAQLTDLGLKNPITAIFNYTQDDGTAESYTLLLGNAADDSHYYAMVPKSDRVYLIAKTDVSAIISIAQNGLNSQISMVEDLGYDFSSDAADNETEGNNSFDY